MVVKIRLARFGKRHAPFYNIVVAHARTARNSKPLEVLGTYDPIPKTPLDGEGRQYKDIKLDTARAKYWLGVGAQPSDPAWRILSMVRVRCGDNGVEREEIMELMRDADGGVQVGLLEPKYRVGLHLKGGGAGAAVVTAEGESEPTAGVAGRVGEGE